MKWHGKQFFNVCRFAYVPNRQTWEKHRKRVLRTCHIDIGEYCRTPGAVISYVGEYGTPCMVIYIEPDTLARTIETISHEAVHVAKGILVAMSEREPGEETLAYMVGQITRIIFEEHNKAVR